MFVSLVASQEVLRQCQASEVQAANNAKPACEPRPTIEYLQDPNDLRRGSTLHPDQILVQKCSGSCLDNNMYQSCIASRKQSRTIQVVEQQMTARGLGDEQCREMEVEDDLECECGCRISEEDCLSTQYFNPNKCQCECNDSNAKADCYNQNQYGGPLKEWNEATCQCRCVEQFRECSSGFVYDSVHTCSCRGFRGGSTTAVVVLIVAIVAMMGCIGFLLARYRRIRVALAKATYSRSQSHAPSSPVKCEEMKTLNANETDQK